VKASTAKLIRACCTGAMTLDDGWSHPRARVTLEVKEPGMPVGAIEIPGRIIDEIGTSAGHCGPRLPPPAEPGSDG
jgi:hypothetical protein